MQNFLCLHVIAYVYLASFKIMIIIRLKSVENYSYVNNAYIYVPSLLIKIYERDCKFLEK